MIHNNNNKLIILNNHSFQKLSEKRAFFEGKKKKRIQHLADDLQEIIEYVNGDRQCVQVYTKALIFSNVFKSTVERRHHRPQLPLSLFALSSTSHKNSFVSTIIDGVPYFGIPLYFFRLTLGYR